MFVISGMRISLETRLTCPNWPGYESFDAIMSFPALPKEHSCSPKDLETGSASKNFVSPAPSMIHPEEDNTGIISIGWQRDAHNLVSVHDNGDRYNPWTSSAHLEDFDPVDACYFADSSPEKRKPDLEGSGYFDFAK